MGDMNGIQPVKNPEIAIPKSSPAEAFGGPGLTWSNLQRNR